MTFCFFKFKTVASVNFLCLKVNFFFSKISRSSDNKGLLMSYFLKDTTKSRKVHNNECSLCLCAFCCALRRPRISCDSLTKVPVFVLKRYNFCLWSFKFRENFVPIWKTILFLCILRCKQTYTVCYDIKRRIKFICAAITTVCVNVRENFRTRTVRGRRL